MALSLEDTHFMHIYNECLRSDRRSRLWKQDPRLSLYSLVVLTSKYYTYKSFLLLVQIVRIGVKIWEKLHIKLRDNWHWNWRSPHSRVALQSWRTAGRRFESSSLRQFRPQKDAQSKFRPHTFSITSDWTCLGGLRSVSSLGQKLDKIVSWVTLNQLLSLTEMPMRYVLVPMDLVPEISTAISWNFQDPGGEVFQEIEVLGIVDQSCTTSFYIAIVSTCYRIL